MPIYEYQCGDCQSVFEEWQSGFEEREMQCPQCGKPATRLISHTSFQLKGSGWYVTDYAGKKPPVKPDGDGTKGTNGTGGEAGKGCETGGAKAPDAEAVPVAKKEAPDTPSAGSAS